MAQCVGVPIREFRGALARSFAEERFTVGINVLGASGYTGQTLENFAASGAAVPTGVRIPSYVSGNVTYSFGEGHARK
jgi:hypothetical protein